MKTYILIALFLLFNNLNAQDQEATLFFNDGTSLKGYGAIEDDYRIKFRLTLDEDDKGDVWTDIMAKGITFYGFDKEVRYEYQYEKFDKSYPLLLEVVEEGNVNLYVDSHQVVFYNYNQIGEGDFNVNTIEGYHSDIKINKYYIKKKNEDLVIKINNKFFYKKAKEYFKDCPSLIENMKSKKYTKSNALDLVYYYNDLCDDEIIGED